MNVKSKHKPKLIKEQMALLDIGLSFIIFGLLGENEVTGKKIAIIMKRHSRQLRRELKCL